MMKYLLGVVVGLSVSACSTPGIEYKTRLMPANIDAAATRHVAVEHFSGPGGRWYANQFEGMLVSTELDGRPWFRLLDYTSSNTPAQAGVYGGVIDVTDYYGEEDTRTNKKCVEWDGLFDCETRAEVTEVCYEETVKVSVTPRLVALGTGEILFSDIYYGDASATECFEADHPKHERQRRTQYSSWDAPRALILDALAGTLAPIREDIAPRNATVRIEFMTEALTPMVNNDARFKNAVETSKSNPAAACSQWVVIKADFPESPTILHNNGVCAEASYDFRKAEALYSEAADASLKYGTIPNAIRRALDNISSQRRDDALIDDLTR